MPNYLLTYHGGKMADSQEGVAKVMAAWEKWMKTIGPALIDGGNPVGKSSTIDSKGKDGAGAGPNPVSGYSVLKADSLEAAIKLAQGCPVLQSGASIEVCETFDVM